MLDDAGASYRYREYRDEPLSEAEIESVLGKLGSPAAAVLRKRDAANRGLGLTGDEPESEIIAAMAQHPTLLQRPIAVLDDRAVLGRPVEDLLELT